MRILVVGGTMFFGIPMVNALLARGLDVTIATRGNAKVDFNGKYNQVILDRTDSSSVKRVLYGQKFDVIIDKIAFSSNDVKALLENVSCDRYIQMSSGSVYYNEHENITEDEFITSDYPLKWEDYLPDDYSATKRNAERAALEYMEASSCTFVRYPVVLGERDYTKRLRFYIEHIKQQKPMNVDDLDGAMSFIYEKEAGEFIAYLAEHPFSGAINGSSNGLVKVSEIINYAEKGIGKKAVLDESGDFAPFNGQKEIFSLNTDKAQKAGYVFSDIESWIYKLIDYEINKKSY